MSSVLNVARLKILVACLVMSLFAIAATIKFNRHCPVCCHPVTVECALTIGASGFMNNYDIIHTNCWGGSKSNSDLRNFYSLVDSDRGSFNPSL